MNVNYQLIALNLRIALLQSKISHQTSCVIARIYGKVEPSDKCTCRAAAHNDNINAAIDAAHDAGLDSELTTDLCPHGWTAWPRTCPLCEDT